jgi:hypothetical protein
MEYKKYSIASNIAEAQLYLNIIDSNMRTKGILGDNERWCIPRYVGCRAGVTGERVFFENPETQYLKSVPGNRLEQTDDYPGDEILYRFKIYNFLSESAKKVFTDPTVPPHAIDYKVHVIPNFYKEEIISKGFCVRVNYWVNSTKQNLLLYVENDYVLDPSSTDPYESGKAVVTRNRKRYWATEEGNFLIEHIRETDREYNRWKMKREEGLRRVLNIFIFAEEAFITLNLVMGDSSTQQEAENKGAALMSTYATEVNLFRDVEVAPLIASLANDTTEPFLDATVTENIYRVPEVHPNSDIINPIVIAAEGGTVRDYLVALFSGQK